MARFVPDMTSSAEVGQAAAVPRPHGDWCLFLDVDGTLLDLADTPDGVEVDDSLGPMLERLQDAAGGAVALVSGRPIADVDALLGTEQFPVAGLHGSEVRDVSGRVRVAAVSTEPLAQLRSGLGPLLAGVERVDTRPADRRQWCQSGVPGA